ncbi:MAG: oxygenase MpaB family protein [Daejeonella sp.]
MEYFVPKNSIVREIWGRSDSILFIFSGAAAEFALNKAVEWLYYTGRLPADPLGRLFSTVAYAHQIVFSEKEAALKAINTIVGIHAGVESSRGAKIPDWAYRDVLFMLIDYSIRSYELLRRKLTEEEKEEVFDVFYRVGKGMQLAGLPTNYTEWLHMRQGHLEQDLQRSDYTIDLYKQYKKHLGNVRYRLFKEAQLLVMPLKVKQLLQSGNYSALSFVVPLYKLCYKLKLDWLIRDILLPKNYKQQIKALDMAV